MAKWTLTFTRFCDSQGTHAAVRFTKETFVMRHPLVLELCEKNTRSGFQSALKHCHI